MTASTLVSGPSCHEANNLLSHSGSPPLPYIPKDISPTTTSASTFPLLTAPNQTDEVLSYVAQIRDT